MPLINRKISGRMRRCIELGNREAFQTGLTDRTSLKLAPVKLPFDTELRLHAKSVVVAEAVGGLRFGRIARH